MHVKMRGIGRREFARLTGIGVDRLDAKTMNVALIHQETHRLRRRPRCVRAVVAAIGESIALPMLAPIGAEQHPVSRRNAAMRALPLLDAGHGEEEVIIGRRLARAIDHASRGYEIRHFDGVD